MQKVGQNASGESKGALSNIQDKRTITAGHTPDVAQLCKGADSNEQYLEFLRWALPLTTSKNKEETLCWFKVGHPNELEDELMRIEQILVEAERLANLECSEN